MSDPCRVGLIVGSLRREAYTLKLANTLVGLAPPSLTFERLEFGALPLYNEDLEREGDVPQEWASFRQQLRRSDAFLFVTPEYNRSMPGGLKNALDVGSRPYGESGWEGKPGAVVSNSPGAMGGFGANHHLRQSCVFLDIPVMPQPEAYVGGVNKLFDEQGKLRSAETSDFLRGFMAAFERWAQAPMPVARAA